MTPRPSQRRRGKSSSSATRKMPFKREKCVVRACVCECFFVIVKSLIFIDPLQQGPIAALSAIFHLALFGYSRSYCLYKCVESKQVITKPKPKPKPTPLSRCWASRLPYLSSSLRFYFGLIKKKTPWPNPCD